MLRDCRSPSAGNDHRLGANEAPPAILSIFLGSELEEIVEALVEGTAVKSHARGDLKLGVTTLPPLPKDTSDRNRTSPFAFTGNKFELRACGASQTLAYPNMVINTIVAESFDFLATEIEARTKSGTSAKDAVQEVVKETLAKHQRIIFSGDNYSSEWEKEAERRGLLNLKNTPDALANFASEKNLELFEKYGVLNRRETIARSNVLYEAYLHRIYVESLSTIHLARTAVMPAAIADQKAIADSINATRAASGKIDLSDQENHLADVANAIGRLEQALRTLEDCQRRGEESGDDPIAGSTHARDQIVPAMNEVRSRADDLEGLVDDNLWPLPKYHELLFIH